MPEHPADALLDDLEVGLLALELDHHPHLCSAIMTYIDLLIQWTRSYNLTTIKMPQAILQKHILDSLSVHRYINGEKCLDVGTGAGLPGLILALAQPERRWFLLDSSHKKTRFIQHVKAILNIGNIDIINSRVEELQPDRLFDNIICRAFASLHDFYHTCHPFLNTNGRLLAMKGGLDEAELDGVRALTQSLKIDKLNVPGLCFERCLVSMSA